MKVLVVVSGNHAQVAPFVTEQAEALRQVGCGVELFCVTGHGFLGYIRNLKPLKAAIRQFNPDIIHAHYGLCGLLCTIQRIVPVVVTYHGSDVNNKKMMRLSRIAMRRAAHNIFVSKALLMKAGESAVRASVIPCGVNLEVFRPMDRCEARLRMGLQVDECYVLFAGSFDNEVKNPQLAREACALMANVKLLELKGYSRQEVALLLNAADCLLMTSHSEGSPQVTKEALACGCPMVSVDVGDVAEQLEGTDAGVIVEPTPQAIATAIAAQLKREKKAPNSKWIERFDNRQIATRLIEIYKTIIK